MYKNNRVQITNEDCVKLMQRMPDKFFQLIICDPPYFEVKGDFDFVFKNIEHYQEQINDWAKELKRVLAQNGTLVWWGLDRKIDYAQVILDKHLSLNSACVWERPGISSEYETRRTVIDRGMERFLVYTQIPVEGSRQYVHDRPDCFVSIKQHIRELFNKAGTSKDIQKATSTYASHYVADSQWSFVTERDYEIICRLAGVDSSYEEQRKQYEEQRKQYEEQNYPRFNNERKHTDVWRYPQDQFAKQIGHPTPKPMRLTKHLISLYSNSGDNMLVPFVGSGTEVMAGSDLGLQVTGSELDKDYFDLAVKRINNHTAQLGLF